MMRESFTAYPDKHGLMATISLVIDPSQKHLLCSQCAKFQIRIIAKDYNEEDALGLIASNHFIRQEYADTFPNLPKMADRAAHGCSLCRFIRSSLLEEYHRQGLDSAFPPESGRMLLTAQVDEDCYQKSSLSLYRRSRHQTILVEAPGFQADVGRRDIKYQIAIQMFEEPSLPLSDPLSMNNVKSIKQWLLTCQRDHHICKSKLQGYTPTRILKIKNDILQLTSEKIVGGGYAALSYCWGSIPNEENGFLTTRSNLAPRMLGFSLSELPNTLQDAVRTARALGIDYIWIDAICIIQDDSKDWTKEALLMSEIYGNALVTIAAATSESSFDGFLNRHSSYRWTSKYAFKELQSFHSSTLSDKSGDIYLRYPPETSIDKFLRTCRWATRGWTLQEALLSTRILYFTKDVIYCECAVSQKLESPGHKLPKHDVLSMLISESKVISATEKVLKKETYLSYWYGAVETYTRRNLTALSDKLPAMDGLAASFKEMIDDTYIYGLWRTDLHRGLLWHSWSGLPSKCHKNEYRAPSWSWASRDGLVTWDEKTRQPGWESLIQVVDIVPHFMGSDENETACAHLELNAPVAMLKDVLLSNCPEDVSGEQIKSFLDEWNVASLQDENERIGTFIIDDGWGTEISLHEIRMMLVAKRESPQNFQALLIRPCQDMNVFERVGAFIYMEYHRDPSHSDDEYGTYLCEDLLEDFEPCLEQFKPGRLTLI